MEEGGTEVIHVSFSPAEVDPVYFPQTEVIGDIANAIWQIKETINAKTAWDFKRILEIRKAGEKHVAEGKDDDRFPIYPQRLMCASSLNRFPSDGIISLDNGVYKIWFARNY